MIKVRPINRNDLPLLDSVDEDWPEATTVQYWSQPAYALIARLVDHRYLDNFSFILGQIVSGEAEIIQITVINEARNQGIGSALLDEFLKNHATLGCYLDVMEGNEEAIRLYQRAGFRVTGRRQGYYRLDGERRDALLMRLDTRETGD